MSLNIANDTTDSGTSSGDVKNVNLAHTDDKITNVTLVSSVGVVKKKRGRPVGKAQPQAQPQAKKRGRKPKNVAPPPPPPTVDEEEDDEEEDDEDEDEDEDEEDLGSDIEERSEDDESIGSLEDFIVNDREAKREERRARAELKKRGRDPMEGIDLSNIVTGKRQRKPVTRYVDPNHWKLMTADIDDEALEEFTKELEEEEHVKTPSTESKGSDSDFDSDDVEEEEDEDEDEEEDEDELTPSEFEEEDSDYEEEEDEDGDYHP